MKRDFNSSIQHARSKYLPTVTEKSDSMSNKTSNLIEGMMNDLAGSVKKGMGKVAGATQSIRNFAQNQKHSGTFGAMSSAGMFDPKGDSQQVKAEWDKLDAGAKKAWEQKGQGFNPPMRGADYFYNQKMKDLADRKTGAVGSNISRPTTSTQPKTPAQQEQAWRDSFRNNPTIQQQAQANNMDEDKYVQFMKAQQ